MPRNPSEPATPPPVDSVTDYETAIKELESLVQTLEQGDLPLETSVTVFERGMALSLQCRKTLAAATQRVETLLEQHDSASE